MKVRLQDRVLQEFPSSWSAEIIRGRGARPPVSASPSTSNSRTRSGDERLDGAAQGKVVVIDLRRRRASRASGCCPGRGNSPPGTARRRFIGSSFDHPAVEGGLKAPEKCVAEQGIPWPQFYQGGIQEILELVGHHCDTGRLHGRSRGEPPFDRARGKLETIIPKPMRPGTRANSTSSPSTGPSGGRGSSNRRFSDAKPRSWDVPSPPEARG